MNKQFFRMWHRRIGVASLLMVLWLAISGVLINHGDALNLNKNKINFSWLNRLYGLDKAVETPKAFLIENNYLFCFHDNIYLNKQLIGVCNYDLLMGLLLEDALDLTESKKYWIFLSKQAVLVFDENFIEIDRIPFSLLGKHFTDLLTLDGQLVLKEQGTPDFWYLDLKSLKLNLVEDLAEGEIKNSQYPLTALPVEISKQLSFPGISVERVLLDAHSGRLFGTLGVLLVDFFAFAFVLLALSGLWIFFKKPR